eukprot:CAMPEP_0167819742 /NCGR_PEP_ID=MMETSP0112_2-20121227/5604_1 /TAXON_ID=91324 /ORGANISM="Lotharella globosa, Strain CCCM811" /LENGTH=320 /DNA_ID=CAMNT_0007720021 /DNA_START=132 /DNA_END=1094 /DNA_ORIENTATION=+
MDVCQGEPAVGAASQTPSPETAANLETEKSDLDKALDALVTPELPGLQDLLKKDAPASRSRGGIIPSKTRKELGLEFLPTPQCTTCNEKGHWTYCCPRDRNVKSSSQRHGQLNTPKRPRPAQNRQTWRPLGIAVGGIAASYADAVVDGPVDVLDPYSEFLVPLKLPVSPKPSSSQNGADASKDKDGKDSDDADSKHHDDDREAAALLLLGIAANDKRVGTSKGKRRGRSKRALSDLPIHSSSSSLVDSLVSPPNSKRRKQTQLGTFMRKTKKSPRRPLSADPVKARKRKQQAAAAKGKQEKKRARSPPGVFTFEHDPPQA